MTPDMISQLFTILLDAIRTAFPLLATGLITFWVTQLHNRNQREKDIASRDEVETQKEQASVDSTKLINRKFEETFSKLQLTQDQLIANEQRFSTMTEKFAEERGGLKQQISDLVEQQKQERTISDTRNSTNDKAIGELQSKIDLLLKKQQELEDKLAHTSDERDTILRNLESKIAELEEAQKLLEQTQQDVNRLIEEKSALEKTLSEKEEQLLDLRKQLDSPRKRSPKAKEVNHDSV